ncbi:uncharacterized protein A4U43_C01F20020 [Asparagus officinalis]|uniref:Uncharacterized protein n=1 Tax=Asparagus officinalis TaxID=4686 RepID=A0A5P1FQQ6_ASPOF|nr:uncharacterized protein A4U43_C01F20020 [Asparagus officinalis]
MAKQRRRMPADVVEPKVDQRTMFMMWRPGQAKARMMLRAAEPSIGGSQNWRARFSFLEDEEGNGGGGDSRRGGRSGGGSDRSGRGTKEPNSE